MIKELRLKKNLTQEELADRCELTKGFISQLENDLNSPSIATLTDILNALGISLSDFFSRVEEEKLVYTPADCFEKATDDTLITWLIPTAQKNMMEPILFEIEPGARTDADLPHDGEEFGYVLAGRIKITVGASEETANKGDSFYIRCGRSHFMENVGKEKARVLWISCPPNF